MADGSKTGAPGVGHNQPEEEVVWERWSKKRTFVRALEGTYGKLVRQLFDGPRVFHSTDWKWHGGPHNFGKKIINPSAVENSQSIECHLDCIAPGGYGQKHGHMNSAVFLVLKGKGFDIHDRKRYDYETGDALIVENGCVHQHLNKESDEELVVLVMKAKPLFLFMHMIFQKIVDWPPKTPVEGRERYVPPSDL
jgi:mannose-6-phosphate isomerase-like protein (cupin superfamily)